MEHLFKKLWTHSKEEGCGFTAARGMPVVQYFFMLTCAFLSA